MINTCQEVNAPKVKGEAKTCQIKTEVSNGQELTDQTFDAGEAFLRLADQPREFMRELEKRVIYPAWKKFDRYWGI